MYQSPQIRRFQSDLAAMEQLAEESSILTYLAYGKPATRYVVALAGRSLARERNKVVFRDHHEIEIKLGSSYPRTMPELRWLSPIYHPNISEIGLVCLGGYGTHWVPSLHLDELCGMLWDMCRFYNYDIRSPYNRDSALWVAHQTTVRFPTDARPLRDRRVVQGRIEERAETPPARAEPPPLPGESPAAHEVPVDQRDPAPEEPGERITQIVAEPMLPPSLNARPGLPQAPDDEQPDVLFLDE